jgi:hypothetical protein
LPHLLRQHLLLLPLLLLPLDGFQLLHTLQTARAQPQALQKSADIAAPNTADPPDIFAATQQDWADPNVVLHCAAQLLFDL